MNQFVSPSPADYERWTAERSERFERYGKPGPVALDCALSMIGEPAGVTMNDIWASRCRDQEAADAWARANLDWHGHPLLGQKVMEDGTVVNVYDLRPALARMRATEAKLEEGGPVTEAEDR